MKPAVLTPRARKDLAESTRWISKDNPTAARAFQSAVRNMAQVLGDHPHAGWERPVVVSPPVRFMALSGFPHIIVYDSSLEPPVILRVLHGARDLQELLDGL